MAAGQVQVFGTFWSPYSRRVEMALRLKGVEYEFVEEDLANKSSLLLQYNPIHKKIPVLVHDGKPVCESLVILEYIEETWKKCPLLPQDPYQRSLARFWAKFIDEKCIPGILAVIRSKGDDRAKAVEKVTQHLKTLEKELKGNKFFGGDKIGYVDLAANFIGFWLEVFQEEIGFHFVTKDNFPVLCQWADEFVSFEPMKEKLSIRCIPGIWAVIKSKGDDRARAVEEVTQHLKTLEKELKGNKFFGGDKIGYVDLAANFIGFWLGVLQEAVGFPFVTEDNFPELCQWADEFVNFEPIKEKLPPREKMVADAKALINRAKLN